MNIYLIRHGDAEKAALNIRDFDRKLTPEGRQKIKNAAEGWKLLVPSFSHIISSPLLRAVQTAEIVASAYDFKEEIILDKRLSFESKTEELIEITNEIMGENMAMFGHEPNFSNHVSNLISSSGAYVGFKKGMIAKIFFGGKAKMSRGILEFLIPARAYK